MISLPPVRIIIPYPWEGHSMRMLVILVGCYAAYVGPAMLEREVERASEVIEVATHSPHLFAH
jgi:hypothetical protein